MEGDDTGFKEFPIENFQNKHFPLNGSRTTVDEINQINKITRDPSFVESTDDVHFHFKKVFDKHGVKYDKNKWHNVISKTLPIIMKLKYHYNRPRPEVIAKEYGINLKPTYLESAQTPAYPSGHSTQARMLSLILADLYPQLKQDIIEAGEEIGIGRLVGKVHYPTDHKFGVELGDALYRHYNSIKKSIMNDNIEKGRALPNGTIKKRGQNNFIKTASGWKYHSRANKKSGGESEDDRAARQMAEADAQEERDRKPKPDITMPQQESHPEREKIEAIQALMQRERDIQSKKESAGIKQTRTVEPGKENSRIGGQYNPEGIKGLLTKEGTKNFEDALKRMTATGRGIALANYTKALEKDKQKAPGYKRVPDEKRMGVGITIKNLQKKYNGTTTAKWGNKEIKISPQDKMTVNGKIVEVDNDSKYVKLGGGGRGSASGGMYSAGHFDGQLQGNDYTFAANRIMHDLREGKSPQKIKEENKDRRGFKEVLDHLGLK